MLTINDDGSHDNFFIGCLRSLAKIEAKLTNEQIEYLHQRYAISHYADKTELKEVAKQWNKNDSKFLLDLRQWFFCRRMVDLEVEERRQFLARIAA